MICQRCDEEVDEVETLRVGSKRVRACEECAEQIREEEEIAAEAEGVVRNMMEYKDR